MDARLIIGGTFGVIALAWIVSSGNSATLIKTIGTTFGAIVKPLLPKQ